MDDLAAIQAGWDQAATEDALFNILTIPEKANHGWDPTDFFNHGRHEIDTAIARLEQQGHRHGHGRALDFGCGVGRLTQALTRHYRKVDGVDISPQMIRLAEHYDQTGRCAFHINTLPTLPFKAGTFDLVYSMIVLQHMPNPLAEGYVKDFIRILKPRGAAMFEIPDGPTTPHAKPWLAMHGTPRQDVETWVREAGAEVVDAEVIDEPSQWDCIRYTATRR